MKMKRSHMKFYKRESDACGWHGYRQSVTMRHEPLQINAMGSYCPYP